MGHDAFRAGVEAQDLGAMTDSLSPDVVFHSPITFKPFEGMEAVSTLLGVVMATFEDFRYTDELDGDGVKALVFEARVGDKQVQGLDLLRFDDEGLIEDFTVMVRPLSAAMALAEAVGKGLERAAAEGDAVAAVLGEQEPRTPAPSRRRCRVRRCNGSPRRSPSRRPAASPPRPCPRTA